MKTLGGLDEETLIFPGRAGAFSPCSGSRDPAQSRGGGTARKQEKAVRFSHGRSTVSRRGFSLRTKRKFRAGHGAASRLRVQDPCPVARGGCECREKVKSGRGQAPFWPARPPGHRTEGGDRDRAGNENSMPGKLPPEGAPLHDARRVICPAPPLDRRRGPLQEGLICPTLEGRKNPLGPAAQ
jgi:hypothetical protein